MLKDERDFELIGHADNKRRVERQPVLKSAKVHFVNSMVDCLILDQSIVGVRVSTELPVVFPDEVTIELRTGALWRSARRWQRGLEAGFELLQFTGLTLASSTRASALYADLQASCVRDLTERLGREGYFDSPKLREAALTLESAYTKMNEAFREALHQS
jgi:hypothetical protein